MDLVDRCIAALTVFGGALTVYLTILWDTLTEHKRAVLALGIFAFLVLGTILAASKGVSSPPDLLLEVAIGLCVLGLGLAIYPSLQELFWLQPRRARYLRQIIQAFVLSPDAVMDIQEIKTLLEQNVGGTPSDRYIKGLISELVRQNILQERER